MPLLPSLGIVMFFAYFFLFSPESPFHVLVGAVLCDAFLRQGLLSVMHS